MNPEIARAAADPVVGAIRADVASGRLTLAEGRTVINSWRRSGLVERRLRGRGEASRAAEIGAVRATARSLAASGRLAGGRSEPVVLSATATAIVMQRDQLPAHEEVVRFDGEAVVFKYYRGRGVQFQPLETFKDGYARVTWLNDPDGARAVADRMLELSVLRRGTRTWEYYFAFGGSSPPWTSGMGQALAAEFYARVADDAPLSLRGRYRRFAEQLVASFSRSPGNGGVAVEEGSGRWYVLYSFNPSQRILNGHLQVLVNLDRYATLTGSRAARAAVTRGVAAVKPMLHRFDTGAWSRYQLGQEADIGYHELQTWQLDKLGRQLVDPMFSAYSHRFAGYRYAPPIVRGTTVTIPDLYPVRDGWRDVATVRYSVDKRSSETVVVRDQAGNAVRTMSAGGPRGRRVVRWNGRDDDGDIVPAGSYSVHVSARDTVGNARTYQLTRPVVVAIDEAPPVLRALAVRDVGGGRTRVGVSAVDLASGHVTVRIGIDGRLVGLRRGPRAGLTSMVVDRSRSELSGGIVVVVDSSGNRASARIP